MVCGVYFRVVFCSCCLKLFFSLCILSFCAFGWFVGSLLRECGGFWVVVVLAASPHCRMIKGQCWDVLGIM